MDTSANGASPALHQTSEKAPQDHDLSRRDILRGGAALAAASAANATALIRTAEARQPNILVMFGGSICQTGALGVGSDRAPNIARMAREGMVFTDCYAEQSGLASLSSFLTGQVTLRTGLSIGGMAAEPSGLRQEDPTITELLESLGYATGHFGRNTPFAAAEFISRQVRANRPFFCLVSSAGTHFRAHFRDDRSTGLTGYAGPTSGYDRHVGLLLEKLDDLGIASDTLVISMADNAPSGERACDGDANVGSESAFRVPCMIRWPGHIGAGQISNEIVGGLDWLPTLLAAAGESDIKQKLLTGHAAAGRTFKVHLDGYNQLPYLLGQQGRGARQAVFCFSDAADLVAMRYENWRISFAEPPVQAAEESFSKLRLPKFFDVRAKPEGPGQIAAQGYYDWFVTRPSLMFEAQAEADKFLATFKEFPPRQPSARARLDLIAGRVRRALTIGCLERQELMS